MSKHMVHVTGWDSWSAVLKLRCPHGPGADCHVGTDEDGNNPEPLDHCNAVEWFDNCEAPDLILGRLDGEPPWPVDIEWSQDGPTITAAGG